MTVRIYCPVRDVSAPAGTGMEIRDDEQHYLARVMRCQPGDPVELFDGLGSRCAAQVVAITKSSAQLTLATWQVTIPEPRLDICLIQGLCSAEKMDWAIEKAIELGAAAVQVLSADRSVVRLEGSRVESRLSHWRRLAIAACRQCGQNRLPEISAPLTLEQWLRANPRPLDEIAVRHRLLLAAPGGDAPTVPISNWQPAANPQLAHEPLRVDILVGPEAGLSDAETACALAGGFVAIRLGDRVLRTETAGLAALAALQTRFGDF